MVSGFSRPFGLARTAALLLFGGLVLLAGCGGEADLTAAPLAVEIDGAPLTEDELANLAMELAAGGDVSGQPIEVDDELLRTLATIHVRSTAIFQFLESQDEETFNLDLLIEQAEIGVIELVEESELEIAPAESEALRNIILADRASNPLRAETDPATGESVVGDNPLSSSFVFDPNLQANFETVSPGFLAQFDEMFIDFTQDVSIAPGLGTWNPDTFSVDAP